MKSNRRNETNFVGTIQKMVVADNCAAAVNNIFADYQSLEGSQLLLGAIFFTFQIYGDFSGYSDIAIGTARLFGINLMRNFNYPYFHVILQSFGVDGTYLLQPGFAIIFTSR